MNSHIHCISNRNQLMLSLVPLLLLFLLFPRTFSSLLPSQQRFAPRMAVGPALMLAEKVFSR